MDVFLLQNELDALLEFSPGEGLGSILENADSGPCLESSDAKPGRYEVALNKAFRKPYIFGKFSTASDNETLSQEDLDGLLTY